MSLVKKFRSYLLEDEFSINILKGKVDIMNYNTIGNIDSNKIVVYYDGGNVTINGKGLSLIKMLDDEILISGTINNIELG